MAQQTGILGIQGTVGGLVFAKDGSIRQKPASNKAAFMSSASLQRTRENASEFGLAASSAKLIREALRTQIAAASDKRMVSRLTKALRAVIGLDATNARGSRVAKAANSAGLLGFNFNLGAGLGQSFHAPYSISAQGAGVTLSIPSLNPGTDVVAPQGATHYRILYGVVSVNFTDMTYKIGSVTSPLGIVALSGAASTNVTQQASLPAAPTADELVIAVVGMDFYQRLNGVDYPLNNNSTNPLAIEYVSAVAGAGTPAVSYTTNLVGPSGTGANTTITSSGAERLEFNELTSGTSGPYNMVISVGGVQKASIDTFDRYAGRPFRFTEANGTAHTGAFGAAVNF